MWLYYLSRNLLSLTLGLVDDILSAIGGGGIFSLEGPGLAGEGGRTFFALNLLYICSLLPLRPGLRRQGRDVCSKIRRLFPRGSGLGEGRVKS